MICPGREIVLQRDMHRTHAQADMRAREEVVRLLLGTEVVRLPLGTEGLASRALLHSEDKRGGAFIRMRV